MQRTAILVAGSSGFLGSCLVRYLSTQALPVVAGVRRAKLAHYQQSAATCVDCLGIDLAPDALAESLRAHRIATVVNCAADYGRSHGLASKLVESNLLLPLRLLEACEQAQVGTFINCNTSLPDGVSPYALSKRQFGPWLSERTTVARRVDVWLEYFYGEQEPSDRLVSRMTQVALDPQDSLQLSPGWQRRDFVHVDDVCSAIASIATTGQLKDGFHEFEVGSGTAISLRELATTIESLAGCRSSRMQFGAVDYRPNEVMHSCADITAMQGLGWRPHMSLADGLTGCIRNIQSRRAAA